MSKLTKRQKFINEKITAGKMYSIDEALQILIDLSKLKFVESVDVAINLGVNPKQSDQVVRGRVVLPNGTGRSGKRIAVFAKGEAAAAAQANGAAIVGLEDLAEEIKKQGKIDADIVLATPDAMRIVGTLGPILGPRGLMPNPKEGTVTNEITNAMTNVLNGVRFRTDKNGIIHCTIGTIKMSASALKENLTALMGDLRKQKPSSAKGTYFKRMTLSTTMGPGIIVDLAPFAG